MSALTIDLSGFALHSLRHGHEIVVQDSQRRCVAVCPHGTSSARLGEVVLHLGPTDLDLIESPEGLHCGTEDRTTGWLVRVAS